MEIETHKNVQITRTSRIENEEGEYDIYLAINNCVHSLVVATEQVYQTACDCNRDQTKVDIDIYDEKVVAIRPRTTGNKP